MQQPRPGILHVVATPIGNLGDLSPRALETLRTVDAICAEDTRHTRQLLSHYGVERPLVALHEHNEDALAERIVARLQGGESLALVSDAGTPLVSDPGFRLVRANSRRRKRRSPRTRRRTTAAPSSACSPAWTTPRCPATPRPCPLAIRSMSTPARRCCAAGCRCRVRSIVAPGASMRAIVRRPSATAIARR